MKRTGLFIRDCLIMRNCTLRELYEAFVEYCWAMGYEEPSLRSFRLYVRLLERLELVELTPEFKYTVNPEKIDDEAWKDPVRAIGYRR